MDDEQNWLSGFQLTKRTDSGQSRRDSTKSSELKLLEINDWLLPIRIRSLEELMETGV